MFSKDIEYPNHGQLCDKILANDTMYTYVSSTYLDGFINYVDILDVKLLSRHTKDWEEEDNTYIISIDTSCISCELEKILENAILVNDTNKHWYKYEFKNYDQFVEAFKLNNNFHTSFSTLRDDVILLAQTDKYYWVFWYDMDCSDSCIGRVEKKLNKDIKQSFEKYIKGFEYQYQTINPSCFTGWLSS